MTIHATKFGLAFGIVYAVIFFVYGLAAMAFGFGAEFVDLIGQLYVGFAPTLAGSIIGAVWGFAIGFVFFGVAAWIYNVLVARSEAD